MVTHYVIESSRSIEQRSILRRNLNYEGKGWESGVRGDKKGDVRDS